MTDITNQTSLENIILTILAVVIILVIAGCVYTFIRAIFLFIFSDSKEENKKKGRNAIRFMIIGIILTIALLWLFPTIFKAMNVPEYDKYTPQNIFNRVGKIINSAFKLGSFIQKSQKENEYRGNLYYDTSPNDNINTDIIPNTDTNSDYNL